MTDRMRFAYADPPYLGCGKLYAKHHPEAMVWDDPEMHRRLIERLSDEYPDGWTMSLHEPSLRVLLPMAPAGTRVLSWCKPFASFKPGVTKAWTWEPVFLWGGRPIEKTEPTWRDHLEAPAISENITLRKGLTGAKPWRFCEWILDGLNFQNGDVVDDLFPGTGVMEQVVRGRERGPSQLSMAGFT